MWTRKDIKEFKDQIRKEKDAVIKISSGETVTVGTITRVFLSTHLLAGSGSYA